MTDPSIPEDVARALQEKIGWGYHGSTHCEIEHEPEARLSISLEFCETDTQKSVTTRNIGGVAKKHDWRILMFDFTEDNIILKPQR